MALKTSRIKTGDNTMICVPASIGHVGATAGAGNGTTNDYSTVRIAASQAAITWVVPIDGLNVGDTITRFRVLGGTAGTAAKTLDATLMKQTAASGAITTPSTVQAATQDAAATAHKVDIDTTLTTASVVATETAYFVILTTTTGAGDTVDYTSIQVYVKKTLGQSS